MLARLRQKKAERKRKKAVRGLENVEIPSFSLPVMRALEMLRSTDASLAEVGRAVASDPSCLVRTLRLANAASSGLRRRVDDVTHAAALLGRHKLESVLVAAAVASAVPTVRNRYFDSLTFWKTASTRSCGPADASSVEAGACFSFLVPTAMRLGWESGSASGSALALGAERL